MRARCALGASIRENRRRLVGTWLDHAIILIMKRDVCLSWTLRLRWHASHERFTHFCSDWLVATHCWYLRGYWIFIRFLLSALIIKNAI